MQILISAGDHSAKIYKIQTNKGVVYGVLYLIKQNELKVCIGSNLVTNVNTLVTIRQFLKLPAA